MTPFDQHEVGISIATEVAEAGTIPSESGLSAELGHPREEQLIPLQLTQPGSMHHILAAEDDPCEEADTQMSACRLSDLSS
jgi:hypothetical protein